ncbi:MAG: HAMP domain-containing sensor histidine kinase [Sulfurisoma sp.]|nr:HAMP domain-containing sensor histidine kinase [Sulfurisoma sp.]
MKSLRQKILVAYAVIAALTAGFSLFSLIELRLLEQSIVAGEQIARYFDTSLEIRRFEKNYFLYRQPGDLDENRQFVAQARALLREHGGLFETLGTGASRAALAADLERYAALMERYAGADASEALAGEIRATGKTIVTVAEALARAERAMLRAQVDRHRSLLLGSTAFVVVLLILIGHLLARRVVRPLKEMEERMKAVAAGRMTQLEMTAGDREIESLTQAFNHVLRELELRQGQLVHSEKLAALGTLLSGVAHELNNPLSNIATSSQILAEEVGVTEGNPRGTGGTAADESAAFQRELIAQIDAETWRARRIVRSLLDYARDREFRAEPLPLGALIDETLRLIRGQIPVQVSVTPRIAGDLVVSGDRQRLQQLFINLVRNAVDALGGAGEVTITARITHEAGTARPPARLLFGQCAGAGEAVEIAVHDNGAGIATEVLPRIFDPFFTTKEIGGGMGLGLFIVFEIVEEHGGCIAVESMPDQGTTFTIRLPHGEKMMPPHARKLGSLPPTPRGGKPRMPPWGGPTEAL